MANKLLKTLTIDGVSADINNDRIPSTPTTKEIPNIQVPRTGYARNLLYTATEDCIVLGTMYVEFKPYSAAEPSRTLRLAQVEKYKNSAYSSIGVIADTIGMADQSVYLTLYIVTELKAGERLYGSLRHGSQTVTTIGGRILYYHMVIPAAPK